MARGKRVILSARSSERAQAMAAANLPQALAVRIDVTDAFVASAFSVHRYRTDSETPEGSG